MCTSLQLAQPLLRFRRCLYQRWRRHLNGLAVEKQNVSQVDLNTTVSIQRVFLLRGVWNIYLRASQVLRTQAIWVLTCESNRGQPDIAGGTTNYLLPVCVEEFRVLLVQIEWLLISVALLMGYE